RPEQGVEVDDVLAAEMDLLCLRVLQQLLEIQAFLRAIVLEGRQLADRRVEPDIEVFLFLDVRDADAEVGRVTRDVPVGERPLAAAFEPLLRLVYDLRLPPVRRLEPLLEEGAAFRSGQPE